MAVQPYGRLLTSPGQAKVSAVIDGSSGPNGDPGVADRAGHLYVAERDARELLA
jgi:hypothetical protein